MRSIAISTLPFSLTLSIITSLASASELVKGSDPAGKPIKEAVARLVSHQRFG